MNLLPLTSESCECLIRISEPCELLGFVVCNRSEGLLTFLEFLDLTEGFLVDVRAGLRIFVLQTLDFPFRLPVHEFIKQRLKNTGRRLLIQFSSNGLDHFKCFIDPRLRPSIEGVE